MVNTEKTKPCAPRMYVRNLHWRQRCSPLSTLLIGCSRLSGITWWIWTNQESPHFDAECASHEKSTRACVLLRLVRLTGIVRLGAVRSSGNWVFFIIKSGEQRSIWIHGRCTTDPCSLQAEDRTESNKFPTCGQETSQLVLVLPVIVIYFTHKPNSQHEYSVGKNQCGDLWAFRCEGSSRFIIGSGENR